MSDNTFKKSRARALAWLLIFISVSFNRVEAQKYFFDNYGVKQGLSEQKVYTLLQDKNDFIWLGTANGVSRFDGKKFENFTSRNGLASGGVKCIHQDSKGDIWFGHLNGGVSRYNGQIFEKAAFDSITFTNDVTSITEMGDSILWFTSISDGAVLARFPGKYINHIKAKQFRGKDGLSDQVSGSYLNKAGEFICIADVGMRRFVPSENKFENYRMPHMTTYFNTICILNDSKGNIWFGTYNGGLYKYVMSQSRMDFIDLPKLGIPNNKIGRAHV
jgi:ligand-binding sensor domain-containing protein